MLIGRVMTDGRLNARVKCDLTENLTLKVNAQVDGSMSFGSLVILSVVDDLFSPILLMVALFPAYPRGALLPRDV